MYSIIKCYLRHILAVCVVSLCVMTGTAASSVKLDVDWPQFMSKQDMVWETLPEYWYESAYMGNGMLGLMIYKEPGQNYIRLETGNCAVHDHRKGKNDLFSIGRLLTGHLLCIRKVRFWMERCGWTYGMPRLLPTLSLQKEKFIYIALCIAIR